jgi:hypothetical protein
VILGNTFDFLHHSFLNYKIRVVKKELSEPGAHRLIIICIAHNAT